MLRNYLTVALRSLLRNQHFALINLTGLSLSLGIAIVLFWIVRFEHSFDRYHSNIDRLYQIRSHDKFGEINSHIPQGIIRALKEQLPGVEAAVNVKGTGNPISVKVGQQVFSANGLFFAPPQLFNMIDVEWVSGSPDQALHAPGQVVLDEATAKRWFGSNAIGQTIKLDNAVDLTVTGIIRKARPNTQFQFEVVVSYPTLKLLDKQYQSENHLGGGDSMFHGYVLLTSGTSAATIETGLRKLVAQHKDESNYVSFDLQPLPESHFDLETDSFHYVMPRWMLYALSCTGLFLIIIACINFINLATVQAMKRSREIAVRKSLGSSRRQLVLQFYGETALLVSVAVLLGSLLASQLAAYADQLLNTQVASSTLWDSSTLIFLFLLGLGVTLLAGGYPALIMSGFEPVRVLRGQSAINNWQGVSLRKTLVVAQFVIAQVLVICTLLGSKQIRYFYQKDLGFSKSGVVTVDLPQFRGDAVVLERFRNQLLQHPDIKDITYGLTSPASLRQHWWTSVLHPNLPGGEATFRLQHVDTNYFHFYRIPLVTGRLLTQADTATGLDTPGANMNVMINEKAARDLGYKSPEAALGQRIEFWGIKNTIIGVVKDYHSEDLSKTIHPHVYAYQSWNFQLASIRIDPNHKKAALQHIETYWRRLYPNYYFNPRLLEDDIRSFYQNERKLSNFLTLFTVIGVFIGCLGLFGLVSFVVVQRTKEIGIRKVLGATVAGIISLLTKDFLKLVGIAFAIAVPLAYYLMSKFLQEYTYAIDISWWTFAIAGGLTLSIALLTVGFQAIKAALSNPVKSLRSE